MCSVTANIEFLSQFVGNRKNGIDFSHAAVESRVKGSDIRNMRQNAFKGTNAN